MSEWNANQSSTAGGAGGCLVDIGCGPVLGIVVAVAVVCALPSDESHNKTQSKIESVKSDTIVNSPDTIAFKNIARQR